jgi:microsomal dipeptidase-like Zn-dependent dipeptidase
VDRVSELGHFDALQHSNWDRELLQQLRDGNLACVHVTTAIWEDARETLRTIAAWNRRFREHADLIAKARSGREIVDVAASGRTAIVLGFQNASPFEQDLGLVEIFHDVGVRIVQLTYNTANHVGSSCYEPGDCGVTRFGRNLIREMNRVGVLIDLSHCGERTSLDAIGHSERPVAITHANPAACWPHERNKSDAVLRALADAGGVLGCAPYPHLTGDAQTGREWAEGVAYAVELMGIDHVGIGTDSSHGWSYEYLLYIRMGHWTEEVNYGAGSPEKPDWQPWPAYFSTPADFPNLARSLEDVGFSGPDLQKLMAGNWLRLYDDGFVPHEA